MSEGGPNKTIKNFEDLMNSSDFVDLEGQRKDIKLDPYKHLSPPAQNEICNPSNLCYGSFLKKIEGYSSVKFEY